MHNIPKTTKHIPRRKRMALIAHDNMKATLLEWVRTNLRELKAHKIIATGTTGHLLEKESGLQVNKLISGPLGGDQQIGALIAAGKIDVVIFFWDPFESMPHDPDVKALLRLAAVWNVPVACNVSTADFLVHSPLFTAQYCSSIPDYASYLRTRLATST